MTEGGATLEPIRYNDGVLEVLDQRLIPGEFKYEKVESVEQGFEAIVSMKVRGAPAIAIVAILSLAVEAKKWLETSVGTDVQVIRTKLISRLDYLRDSRPTAVNLFIACDEYTIKIQSFIPPNGQDAASSLLKMFLSEAEKIIEANVLENELMSNFGSNYIQNLLKSKNKQKYRVLTHCNTGALATSKYGTALGVARFLYKANKLERIFATETRPYNQGARLTAFEMAYEKIPVTLIVDSAVSYLLQSQNIDAIVVGADRICANGDTANKIGTYHIAISAQYHKIPFFVAAPITSIDVNLDCGSKIKIEERSEDEIVKNPQTKQRVVAQGVDVWNPGFDVTPASLISAIFTEIGVLDSTWKREDGTFDVKGFIAKNSPSNSQ